jgi:hypothetical protein
MSFGFSISSSAGLPLITSEDFTVAVIDVFEVSPLSSGSRTYQGAGSLQFFTAQTAVEPTTVTVDVLSSLNSLAISTAVVGQDKVVSWSPGARVGTVQNVVIYVLGA